MSYVVLARKYRPQKFSEVIGQKHITGTLLNAIKLDKIAHAYLFTGPRGVGKTSTARIFAKAVNCKNSKETEPCNSCSVCREITSGESLDIIEIDAASNTGVDDIRELRENVKFAPGTAQYKVYIIDEVHMLSKQAFNAILKTLEEPPPHVIFIMATTEPEKVLDTVVSRCQTFNFKLISDKKIMDSLKNIADSENIKYDSEGLWMIARAGAGSMRDAQSIMDQVLSYSLNKIDAGYVAEILGLIPREFLFKYSGSIIKKNVKEALMITEKLINEGYSVNRLFDEMLLHFRNIMLARIFREPSEMPGFDQDYADKLIEDSEAFTQEHLTWIIEYITKNSARIKYSQNPRIVFDTVIFKLCQRFVSYDDILKVAEASVVSGSPDPDAEKRNQPETETSPKPEIKQKPAGKDPQEEEPVFEDPDSAPGGEESGWDKVRELIKKERPSLYFKLQDSKATVTPSDKKVAVSYGSALDLADKEEEIIKKNIKKIAGKDYRVTINRMPKKKVEEEIKEKPVKKRFSPSEIEDEVPVIETIIDEFGGKIERN